MSFCFKNKIRKLNIIDIWNEFFYLINISLYFIFLDGNENMNFLLNRLGFLRAGLMEFILLVAFMTIIFFLLFSLFIKVSRVDIIELWIWFCLFDFIGVRLLILLKKMMEGRI